MKSSMTRRALCSAAGGDLLPRDDTAVIRLASEFCEPSDLITYVSGVDIFYFNKWAFFYFCYL